jgi:hypothetical protein
MFWINGKKVEPPDEQHVLVDVYATRDGKSYRLGSFVGMLHGHIIKTDQIMPGVDLKDPELSIFWSAIPPALKEGVVNKEGAGAAL